MLVTRPLAAYEADCELLGEIGETAWLGGIRRGLLVSQHGANWWQRLLIELAGAGSECWEKAIAPFSRKPRPAPLTPTDERAGRFRFTADGLATVNENLRNDKEDATASAYAWLLWCASAKAGLRTDDLRAAQVKGEKLVNGVGDVLLPALSQALAGPFRAAQRR